MKNNYSIYDAIYPGETSISRVSGEVKSYIDENLKGYKRKSNKSVYVFETRAKRKELENKIDFNIEIED